MPSPQNNPRVVRAASQLPDPTAALRAALHACAREMGALSALPSDIIGMTWTSRSPASIHPARTAVDLCRREIFGGITPPMYVHAADHDGIEVELQLRSPSTASSEPVWQGFTLAQLARQYSPRATVSDMEAVFDSWRQDGATFRSHRLAAELRYGPLHDETLDIYLPATKPKPLPLWIIIHGGYWQAIDKQDNAHFAAGMLEAGFAVAMLNHTLAPLASLQQIVQQVQRAIEFLAREASALGCDANSLHIAGHSAGGHLAAMVASTVGSATIRSCLPLSGVFDLEPLARLPMGRTLGLDAADVVADLSPIHMAVPRSIRLGIAVGGNESAEFQRQSTAFAARNGAPCRIIAGRNHFDLLEGLNGGELLEFARAIAS